MHKQLTLAFGLLAATTQVAPAVAPEQPASPAVRALLERARLWDDRNRPQLARETLEKLLRAAPEHPEALAALARVEARADRPVMARAALERLRKIAPDHPAITGIEMQLRLNGPDRNKLEQIRQIAKQSRQQDRADLRQKALMAYRDLFAGARPEGDLALEYWQFVAADWDTWDAAHAGLAELVQQHPDSLRYRYTLAEHETTRLPLKREALQIIIDMTKLPEYERQARAAWRRVMLRLDATPENIPLIDDYLKRETTDSGVQERRKTLIAELETKQRLPLVPAVVVPATTERPVSAGLALLEKGELDAAELQLERELHARPGDTELIGGLGLIRLRQGHHAQAQAFFEQARRLEPQSDKWPSLLDTVRFWGLLREAADARGARDSVLAEDKLQAARTLNPREPQGLIALARVQTDRQLPEVAAETYRTALKLDPVNRTALIELIELLARTAQRDAARRMVTALTPAQRTALGRDADLLEAAMRRSEADEQVASGRLTEAEALLESALPLDPDNVWLRYDLGRLLVARQAADRGFALFDPLLTRHPDEAAARYALALLQSAADRELEALLTLEQVAAAARDDKLTRFQRELWAGLQLQQARTALRTGRSEAARRLLEEVERATGNDPSFLSRLARGWAEAGEPARALTLFENQRKTGQPLAAADALSETEILIQADQTDTARSRMAATPMLEARPDLWHALARTEIRRGNATAAEPLLRHALTLQPDFPAAHTDLIEVLMAQARTTEAASTLAALRTRAPESARLYLLAGRLAQAQGDIDTAIDQLQRGLALERAERQAPILRTQPAGSTAAIDAEILGPLAVALPTEDAETLRGNYELKQLAGMIDARANWLSGTFDQRERVGTPGVSQYLSQETSAEAMMPLENGDRWWVRSDAVKLDAGHLDRRDTGDVESFGSLAVCAATVAGCRGAGRLTAEGISLAAGWQRRDLKIDLGTTPLNFPVTHWTGGIANKGDLGDLSWSAELSRRPLTGSLLSWAGAKDPHTGRTWGGVVATGGRIGLSYDRGGTLGFWSSLGLHQLTGVNVQDNQRLQLMAGGYWRVVNRENHLLSVGLTGMNWRFDKNVGEYTFGHGGYYSPATYQSLSLPITWAQRFARFAYVVRAATTVSQSTTDAALYYPTAAALQALAVARGVDATYAASPNNAPSARGWSLHLGWEYQFDPRLFLGGRVEIERAADYAPDRYLIYLRYNFDRPAAQPVRLPPEPFVPYSQY